MSALGQLLDFVDPLRLDLVQGFTAGQPDIIHPLGVGDPQTAALTSSQQQRPHSALGNLQQSWPDKTVTYGKINVLYILQHCMNQAFLQQKQKAAIVKWGL